MILQLPTYANHCSFVAFPLSNLEWLSCKKLSATTAVWYSLESNTARWLETHVKGIYEYT